MKTQTTPNTNFNSSSDLARQRSYVDDLKTRKFEFGLVLGHAFVKGMRDIGYKSTSYALDELIDNGIQAGAENIHVAFGYGGKSSEKKPEMIAVIDDGHGMDPEMIRASVIWGGTHRQDDRTGFGRYGYGLPSACVSIGRRYTVYSRVQGGDWNQIHVDLDEIGEHFKSAQGMVVVPEATKTALPKWVQTYTNEHFSEMEAGTVVVIEKIDRIDYKATKSLTNALLQDFGITYRNFLRDVSIRVDGDLVEATDPLFLTPTFRFYDIDEDRATAIPPLEVEVRDRDSKESLGIIKVRFALMPPTFLRIPEDKMKNKGAKHNARFKVRRDNNGFIVLRGGRQIDVISSKCPTVFQGNDRYVGIELDFPPTMDEEFSITTSKQQVGLKDRIWDLLKEAGVFTALSNVRSRYKKMLVELTAKIEDAAKQEEGKRPSEEAFAAAQSFFSQRPGEKSPKQQEKSKQKFESAVEDLAEKTGLPKAQAREHLEAQATNRPFKIQYEDLPGAPFYRAEQVGGQMVLYINKGHRFYTDLYANPQSSPHVRFALDVLLMVMGSSEVNANEQRQAFYEQERQAWSINFNTTLRMLEEWDTSEDVAAADAAADEMSEELAEIPVK